MNSVPNYALAYNLPRGLIGLFRQKKKRFTEVPMKHSQRRAGYCVSAIMFLSLALLVVPGFSQRRQQAPKPTGPWMDTSLSPDQRADLLIKEMTLDEKIAVLHGVGMPTDDPLTAENMPSNRGVGYEVGVPRLGIPGIDMSDAAYGIRSSGANGRYATALPANVAAAAFWSPDAVLAKSQQMRCAVAFGVIPTE